MKKLLLVLVYILSISPLAHGGEVLRVDDSDNMVWVSTTSQEDIQVYDQVCLYKKEKLIGCGEVTATTDSQFALKFYEKKGRVFENDNVRLGKAKKSLASTNDLAEKFNEGKSRDILDIALGFNAGLNYYYPSLQIQLAVARSFAIGISPAFAKYGQDEDDVTMYGGYLTATYYHTHFAFKGFNFEGGFGMFNIKASNALVSEEIQPFAAKLTAGWRGRALIGMPIDFGGNLGAQYIFADEGALDTNFKGILPLLNVYMAFSF